MTPTAIKTKADVLSAEKQQLGAIRSLLEDDRFVRYVGALEARYDATVGQFDLISADDSLGIAEMHGVRKTYKHELMLISTARDRIKAIDEQLVLLNKERKNKIKGTEGISNIVPPKE